MNILKITHPHYYSEWDKEAAQWLRNLIARGLLPPGDVDDGARRAAVAAEELL